MTTRLRTLGSVTPYYNRPLYRSRTCLNIVGGDRTWTAWSVWRESTSHNYGSGDWESMTDTYDRPKQLNAVTHTSQKASVQPNGVTMHIVTSPEVQPGSGQYEWKGYVPLRSKLLDNSGPLGALSGIKALAVARVPAYHKATVEGFISLMEAREMSRSVALKSGMALGHFLKNVHFEHMYGSGARKLLTREAARALKALKSSMKDPMGTIKTVLAGINGGMLEWKYGWAPMIDDLQKASKAVDDIVAIRTKLLTGVRVYGRAQDTRRSDVTGSYWIDNNLTSKVGKIYLFGQKVTKTTAVASIVRRLNPSSTLYDVGWFNSLDCVMEVNGLNPSAKKIWQLSNLTFITDWFWNVSNLLESFEGMTAPVGSSFTSYDGMYSLLTETTVSGLLLNVNNTGSGPTSPIETLTNKSYTRDLDSLTGVPLFYVPPLQLDLSPSKWFSIGQIALQNFLQR